MKKMIKFLRGVHPFIFLPILFLLTFFFLNFARPIQLELTIAVVMAETFITLGVIFALNKLTKGKYKNDDAIEKYKAEVTVTYFGENVRWTGYFKNKNTAKFCAIYQAWFLDHFGDVHPDWGIRYYVNSIN